MRRLVLVAFDIADPRRLRRISRLLEGHGERVQLSVFECFLSPSEQQHLIRHVASLLQPDEDSVIWYPLCPKDHRGICIDGQGTVTTLPGYSLI